MKGLITILFILFILIWIISYCIMICVWRKIVKTGTTYHRRNKVNFKEQNQNFKKMVVAFGTWILMEQLIKNGLELVNEPKGGQVKVIFTQASLWLYKQCGWVWSVHFGVGGLKILRSKEDFSLWVFRDDYKLY